MKGLTIHQPWAWLIAEGVKQVENRTWRAPYRGRIAIHAGKSLDSAKTFSWSALPPGCRERFDALPMVTQRTTLRQMGFGVILATAELVDCLPLEEIDQDAYPFAVGPWCWVLKDVVRLDVPIPHQGKLGLWTPRVRIERRGAPGLDVPATDKAKKPWRDGFVFHDVRETPPPFLVAPWLGDRWLFYWSEETHWTSFRRVTDDEAALFRARAVKQEEAEAWHERHETWLEGVKRDS